MLSIGEPRSLVRRSSTAASVDMAAQYIGRVGYRGRGGEHVRSGVGRWGNRHDRHNDGHHNDRHDHHNDGYGNGDDGYDNVDDGYDAADDGRIHDRPRPVLKRRQDVEVRPGFGHRGGYRRSAHGHLLGTRPHEVGRFNNDA